MTQFLNFVGWLACVVYSTIPSFWLVIHPRVDHWRSQRSPYRVLVPSWMAMWVAMAAITWRWRDITLYMTPWTWIPAVPLFASGLWLYFQSGREFSARQLGGLPELLPGHREQRLVTSGIRARVRHPVYLGHLCEMLGWSLGTGLIVIYALTAFALLTGAIMIRLEDDELEQRFGEDYRLYRKSVSAIIPSLSVYNPDAKLNADG